MKSNNWQETKRVFNEAIELSEPERIALLELLDDDLRLEVEKLLDACDSLGDFIAEPAFVELGLAEGVENDLYIGRHIDQYRIIRVIGHGGMGTVYLGNRADDSFDRPVAIKLIKRGMDTSAVLKRFVMERRILAQLQHPNISSLLDGGTTSDGLPYFVMEFVEGQPITTFCTSQQIPVRERLELFTKVCSAVSFAHQNLVVHRDIKPSNIIVTADGTPKLLDFGIAKLLHSEWSLDTNEVTATMFRLLTPEYASPEQIRGIPVTTASDVYSLGVVLYELLSGERPFRFESRLPEEIAREVLSSQPAKPSSVVSLQASAAIRKTIGEHRPTTSADGDLKNSNQDPRSLRGDLDNIVLKALRKEPERRYQSVQEFSEDIRRHLAGLPVTATADTAYYRLNKFVKRHRVVVLAGTLVILTLLASTAVTAWQAVVASRERDKAEKRFDQVRKLAHTVLFEYHDGVAKLAGSTLLREKMIKDALEYLDNLAADNISDPSLQNELATAYEKVGDVQGNPYLANLGDQAGALASYQKALAIREAMHGSDPDDPRVRYDVATDHEMIGDILWAQGENSGAEENYNIAFAAYSELARNGTSPDVSALGRIFSRLGQIQSQNGNFDKAVVSYESSLKEAQALVAAEPANDNNRRGVAVALAKIGDILFEQDKYREAAERFQSSLVIFRELSEADPTNVNLRRPIGLVLARLALAEMKSADYSSAVEHDREAVTIQKGIATADPDNVQIRNDLSATLANLGETYGLQGNLVAAGEYFRAAIAIASDSGSKNSDYAQARRNSGGAYQLYARILLKNGQRAAALENYRRARELLESSLPVENSLEDLAEVYDGMADAIASIDRGSRANTEIRDLYQKSLNAIEQLKAKHKLSSESTERESSVRAKLIRFDQRATMPIR